MSSSRRMWARGRPICAIMLSISTYAGTQRCDQIVMGTRGLGSYTGGLLGSIAHGVAQHSPVPVLLVK